MTALDLDHLERVAREATPGEWHRLHDGTERQNTCECGQVWSKEADWPVAWCDTSECGEGFSPKARMANAAHIAACDPPTVLALISRLRAAEARADDAERRGWIAGRDAAARHVFTEHALHEDRRWAGKVADEIAALTPPQEPSTNG